MGGGRDDEAEAEAGADRTEVARTERSCLPKGVKCSCGIHVCVAEGDEEELEEMYSV